MTCCMHADLLDILKTSQPYDAKDKAGRVRGHTLPPMKVTSLSHTPSLSHNLFISFSPSLSLLSSPDVICPHPALPGHVCAQGAA